MTYKIKTAKKMKDNRIDKTGYINVVYSLPDKKYHIMFFDSNGMSLLAKTKSKATAISFAKKYNKDLYSGKLLKEDKSVWS